MLLFMKILIWNYPSSHCFTWQ